MKRPPAYYRVAGIDLHSEMERLRGLPIFAGGPLAAREPLLKIRRASRQPNRLGFAVPSEWRLQVTDYPGIRAGDALETLLHELTHLHVGRQPGGHAWHGRLFKLTLAAAMVEAYELEPKLPRNSLHGHYADAIESKLRGGRRSLAGAAA